MGSTNPQKLGHQSQLLGICWTHHQTSHICWKLYPLFSWVMWLPLGHQSCQIAKKYWWHFTIDFHHFTIPNPCSPSFYSENWRFLPPPGCHLSRTRRSLLKGPLLRPRRGKKGRQKRWCLPGSFEKRKILDMSIVSPLMIHMYKYIYI